MTETDKIRKMRITSADEDYLEAVFMLGRRSGNVRSVDVAEELGISRPSVSAKVHMLEDAGLLSLDAARNLHLTAAGRRIAEKTYEKHRLLKAVLIHMGVEPVLAEQDACRLEHRISDTTYFVLKARCAEAG